MKYEGLTLANIKRNKAYTRSGKWIRRKWNSTHSNLISNKFIVYFFVSLLYYDFLFLLIAFRLFLLLARSLSLFTARSHAERSSRQRRFFPSLFSTCNFAQSNIQFGQFMHRCRWSASFSIHFSEWWKNFCCFWAVAADLDAWLHRHAIECVEFSKGK